MSIKVYFVCKCSDLLLFYKRFFRPNKWKPLDVKISAFPLRLDSIICNSLHGRFKRTPFQHWILTHITNCYVTLYVDVFANYLSYFMYRNFISFYTILFNHFMHATMNIFGFHTNIPQQENIKLLYKRN